MSQTPLITWPLVEPGFHPSLPMEHYLGMPAASNSRLGQVAIAPAKLKEEMDNPQAAKDWGNLGTAIHSVVLEPDDFAARYVRAGRCSGELKSGANKGKQCTHDGKLFTTEGWRCGTHGKGLEEMPNKTALTGGEWRTCMGIRDNCLAVDSQHFQPKAHAILAAADLQAELTGRWDDPVTGQPAKLRGDGVSDYLGTVADIKSTRDASPDVFTKTIFALGYYRGAGFYHDGFDVLGRPMKHHIYIAVEKEPPYLVAVYRLLDDVVQEGLREARELMQIYDRCVREDHWPGYPQRIIDIGLPAWAWKQLAGAQAMQRALL